MNIYVGNLHRDATEQELKDLFTPFGEVTSASIIKDRYSGQSRGFAFVEMPNKAEGQAAISGLNGKAIKERTISVSEARPRTEGGAGGGYGGGRGGDRSGGGSGGSGGRQRRY